MPNLAGSSVPTSMQVGVTSATLANSPNREVVRLFNGGPAALYLGYGTPAVASTGFLVPANTGLNELHYGGLITGITAGSAFVYVNDIPHG